MLLSVSIIGLGVVGGAFYQCLKQKHINVYGYDKYKDSDSFEDVLSTDIAFLSLPTPYDTNLSEYDKSAIYDVCQKLNDSNYKGCIVLQSTVEPETTNKLDKKYPLLNFIHSPEFISARTAFEDMNNQSHVVLGKSLTCSSDKFELVCEFYKRNFPSATISVCDAIESEVMKIGVNSFYAIKVQYFTELFLLCKGIGASYEVVKEMMLKNGWINKMHTIIPGTDGQLSYGGMCFPKDTRALLKYMRRKESECAVLQGAVEEQIDMRG